MITKKDNYTLLNISIENALNFIIVRSIQSFNVYPESIPLFMDFLQLSKNKYPGNLIKTDFRVNALEKIQRKKSLV